MKGRTVILVALVLAVAACSTDTSGDGEGVEVVVTTSILADVVADLVGEHGSVAALMEPGTDPHEFTPSAEQASLLRSADLVVANGLGLEAGLTDMLETAADDGANVVELADQVDPLPFGGSAHEDEADEHGGAEDHGDYDPHFFLDPLRMAEAMEVVADALSQQHPSVDWDTEVTAIRTDLESLHREITEELAAVPADRRKLVTNHDALGYFADRYDFEVVGTVIPGGSTMAEPSASDLAELADLLRREGVNAVFADTTSPTRLAETLAAEVGGDVEVHALYTGSLGPEGSGTETYAGVMRANAATIAGALGS